MKTKYIVSLLILCAILLIAGLITFFLFIIPNDASNSEASKNLVITDVQVYTDLQGNPITFEAYEGKVRVVNSWASWTPFSVAELTDLESLAQEFKSKDVVILAINRKEPKEIANQFLKTIQEFKEIVFIIDITDAYYASTRGFAMPETVIYDATGKIVFHKRGQMTKEEMQKYVTLAITQSN